MKADMHVTQYLASGQVLLQIWKPILDDIRRTTTALQFLQRAVGSDSYTPNPALDQVRKSVRDSRWSWAVVLAEASATIFSCAMLADACSDTLLQDPAISEADIGTTLFLIVVDVNKLRGQVVRLANRVLGFSALWSGAIQDAMVIGIGRPSLPSPHVLDHHQLGSQKHDHFNSRRPDSPNSDTSFHGSASYTKSSSPSPVSLAETSLALLQGHLRDFLAYLNNWMQRPAISDRSTWNSIELDRQWLENNWSMVPAALDDCLAFIKAANNDICREPPTLPFPLDS